MPRAKEMFLSEYTCKIVQAAHFSRTWLGGVHLRLHSTLHAIWWENRGRLGKSGVDITVLSKIDKIRAGVLISKTKINPVNSSISGQLQVYQQIVKQWSNIYHLR